MVMAIKLHGDGAQVITMMLWRGLRSVSRELQHNGHKREADFVAVDRPRMIGRQIGVILQAQRHPPVGQCTGVMPA